MVLVAFVLVVSSVCLAQEKTPVPEHDGPYVFWHDSATATVFYLCQGEVHEQTFEDFDTLRFHKFCEEEAIKHAIPVEPPAIEPAVYTEVPRIFVVSDIHGEIEALLELLKAAGVIDDDTHWNWGDGHMVIDGDIFDRGDRVTEVLWLVYRLEQEARRAGGRVHYLIGNHDEMVIHGDNRYVHDKYTKGIARKARIRHQDLFGPSMELGRWLRTKPTIMRLNDVLFVHGGISPELVERGMTIESVNEQMRRTLTMNSGQIHFSDVPKFLLSSKGPLWYRGFVMDLDDRYDRLAKDEVASILEYFEASAVVVGHTETDQIEQHYDGLVYTVDVPLDELGTLQGLLWESGKFYRVTGTGVREVWE
jgi:hypothetical protein